MKTFKIKQPTSNKDKKVAKELALPHMIPWSIVAPYEMRAMAQHSMTLDALNDAGGLGLNDIKHLFIDGDDVPYEDVARWFREQIVGPLRHHFL